MKCLYDFCQSHPPKKIFVFDIFWTSLKKLFIFFWNMEKRKIENLENALFEIDTFFQKSNTIFFLAGV